MEKTHIEIKQNDMKTEVFINGRKIEGVRKVSFEHDSAKRPILQLEFLATDTTIDCIRIPELPDAVKPFYEKKH